MGRLSLRQRRMLSRGIGPRAQRRWPGRVPFLSLGIGNRAKLSAGTGNSAFVVYSRVPGTVGNATTFRVVIPAGAGAVASVAVVGAAVTFNSATAGAGVASSTVKDMARLVNSDVTARPLVHVQAAPGSDGTGIVAALAATALSGAT